MSLASYEHLPPHLRNLLESNFPVDHGQTEALKEYVAQQGAALKEHRTELADIAKQLEALAEKQQSLIDLIARDEQIIGACERRLSMSISSLPAEVLDIVFTHSIPSASVTRPTCRHSSTYYNQPPFSLIQVCRGWREVALSSPHLWTSFSLRIFDDDPAKMPIHNPAFQEMVKAHYKRTGNLPKSLDVYVNIDTSKTFSSVPSPARSVFNEGIKITNLSLGSTTLGVLLHALGRSEWWKSSFLQSVESLVLHSESQDEISQARLELFSRKRLKSLRRLTLHIGTLLTARIWAAYYIPWKNLTHIAITSWMQYRDWALFFPKLKGLQHGIFYIKHDEASDQISPIHTFPNLLDLTLIFHNTDITTITLEQYKLPSIQHLRLGAYRQPFNLKPFDLVNLHSSLVNLTSLSLCHLSWEAPVQTIAEILLVTINLKSLTLGISTNYDQLLEQFQIDWNGFALLPNLESFTIDCVPSRYGGDPAPSPARLILTADGFASMVKDRWRPLDTIAQLRKAALYLSRGHERLLSTIRGSLKAEVKEGLVLEVRSLGEGCEPLRMQWVDPLEKSVGHWHEGLVLKDREEDCARCLEDQGQDRLLYERLEALSTVKL